MRFNIAAFTHVGTHRDVNQDRILVQDSVYSEGMHFYPGTENCFCFVADGVGGGPHGDIAAQFVLNQIHRRIPAGVQHTEGDLGESLTSINSDLLKVGQSNASYFGMATTLIGIIIGDDGFNLINVGDSHAYVFRNDSMIKLTEEHVLDPFVENSPVTSYFGGKQDELHLDFDTVLRKIDTGDLFLFASDGLYKSLSVKRVKAILSNSTCVAEKAMFILDKALEASAEDNISCILIEVTN